MWLERRNRIIGCYRKSRILRRSRLSFFKGNLQLLCDIWVIDLTSPHFPHHQNHWKYCILSFWHLFDTTIYGGEPEAIDFLEFGRLSSFKGNYCHLHAIFGDCFEFSIAPYKTVACEKWRFSSKWLDRYHEVIRLLSKIENTAKKSNLLIFLAEDDLFSLFWALVWICDSSLYDSGLWNMLE
jgi:hypothetical protein